MAAGSLAAGCALLAMLMPVPAIAQQQGDLRGAVSEREIQERLRSGTDGIVTGSVAGEPYRLSGSGAEDEGLFGRRDGDVFAEPMASEPGTPTTARERRQARRGEPAEIAPAPAADEEDLTTGAVRVPSLADYETEDMRRARAAERTGAIEGLARRDETSPFAPVGIRAGTFRLLPSLEQGIGATTNAGLVPGGRMSLFSETNLRLEAISDWSRHSARLTAEGLYRKSISGAPLTELVGEIDGELRLDLAHDYFARASIGYTIRPEAPTVPGAVTNVASRPNRHTIAGSATIGKDMGPARFSATGRVARDHFEPARLVDDTMVSQRERNTLLASLALRGGYRVSPALMPFLEAEIGRRWHDVRVDSDGFERSANRLGLRGGVELDFGEKLDGEISAGWLHERPDDSQLQALSGLSVDAALNWSPVRGTTVALTGTTAAEGTTVAGQTGALLYSGNLSVTRQLRADLTATALVGADFRRYSGTGDRDVTLRAETSFTWWMNRYAGLTGRIRHEVFSSTLPDRDARATSAYLGMRLQR